MWADRVCGADFSLLQRRPGMTQRIAVRRTLLVFVAFEKAWSVSFKDKGLRHFDLNLPCCDG